MNQKGFAQILVVLLLLLTIPIGVYLTLHPTFFNPKASESSVSSGSTQTLGVLVIRYFPKDSTGRNLDPNITGSNESIYNVRNRVGVLTDQIANDLTNGTKYHAFKTNSRPALNYNNRITIYTYEEPIPLDHSASGLGQPTAFLPDYMKILNRVNICDFVDNKNVKQVWLWGYQHDITIMDESNMAMGKNSKAFWNFSDYGDVSNSYRTKDMPICNNTYVLFGYNYTRTDSDGTMLEDHGHQIEALYSWLNISLWSLFRNPHGTDVTPGGLSSVNHCGWTHSPPNAGDWAGKDGQYDWSNKRTVSTDCEDWKPDGGGAVQNINCDRWNELFNGGSYASKDCNFYFGGEEYKVWWQQNIPGLDNTLTYQGFPMKNWWSFYGDLDSALAAGPSLTAGGPNLTGKGDPNGILGYPPKTCDDSIKPDNCTCYQDKDCNSGFCARDRYPKLCAPAPPGYGQVQNICPQTSLSVHTYSAFTPALSTSSSSPSPTPGTPDSTAPTTSIEPSGNVGSYLGSAVFHQSALEKLSCKDNKGGWGCDLSKAPQFCIDSNNTCTPNITSIKATFSSNPDIKKYIRFKSADLAGNVENTKSTSFIIDDTPPVVNIISPSRDGFTTNPGVTFDVRVSLNDISGIKNIEVWWDSASMCYTNNPSVDQTYVCHLTVPNNAYRGSHTIKVTALDNATLSTDSYRQMTVYRPSN